MEYKLISPINPQLSITEQILTNRGIALEDIPHYLSVTETSNYSCTLLKNIDMAAKMLLKHIIKPNGLISVTVDADFDGYASSALLLNYIHARWPSAVNKFQYILHDSKIHGIEMDKLPEGVTLVLVPDAGSNQYEYHEELAKRGIDVCILDHHITDRESEFACVVNNQLCDYPNKYLCGCGIVYKLCQYIDKALGDIGFVDQFIDIVGCSNVADMMDIRSMETHYLIQQGLARIRNPFLKGMVDKNSYSIGDEVTPIGIAFYVVPFVNAVTRVGTMEEKILLFESMLEYKAYEMIPSIKRGCKGQQETRIEQSLRTCINVKARQTREQDAATELLDTKIHNENLLEHKVLLIQLENAEFDRGITGLCANRLMATYQRPVLLLIKGEHDGKIFWRGSGRAPGKCGLEDFREFCEKSGLCEYAQGHQHAFGVSILDENIGKFLEYSNKELANIEFSPSYKVDFIYDAQHINPNDILEIGRLKGLWGQELEESLIAVENIKITCDMLQLMSRDKNPTLKITLPNEISCIKFKSSEEEYNSLLSQSGCVTINIIGKCNVNTFMGKTSPQILIQDYEIINRQEYYF